MQSVGLRRVSAKFILLLVFLLLTSALVHACQCGMSGGGKNAWEIAQKRAQANAVIFEGRVKTIELTLEAVTAKPGEMILADFPYPSSESVWPYKMVDVVFDVLRPYRGTFDHNEVRLHTGLGGGDCAARYATGITYLVYAYGKDMDHLFVSMCSPGGPVDSDEVATELRFLKGERPKPADLAPWRPIWRLSKQEQDKHYGKAKERLLASTAKVCGKVIRQGSRANDQGEVLFLSTLGYSPGDHPTAVVDDDGNFCSERLGPGSYYLFFVKGSEKGLESAAFYPGVGDKSQATPIEVQAGHDQEGLVFNVPKQDRYTVRGFISTNDRTGLGQNSVDLVLLPVDAIVREAWHVQSVDFTSFLPLPKTKYFSFEDVPPGRYVVYAQVQGQGWKTKKTEVTVDRGSRLISVELTHRK